MFADKKNNIDHTIPDIIPGTISSTTKNVKYPQGNNIIKYGSITCHTNNLLNIVIS